MPLKSELLRDSEPLQACLSNRDTIEPESRGGHIGLLQTALSYVGEVRIAHAELSAGFYGPSTSAAVLAFKASREIVSFTTQSGPDDRIGPRTLAAIDAAASARERQAVFSKPMLVARPALEPEIPPPPDASLHERIAQLEMAVESATV